MTMKCVSGFQDDLSTLTRQVKMWHFERGLLIGSKMWHFEKQVNKNCWCNIIQPT